MQGAVCSHVWLIMCPFRWAGLTVKFTREAGGKIKVGQKETGRRTAQEVHHATFPDVTVSPQP